MPKKENLKKVMVIGSGPIIIGQAAEFDYAGSQACRSLKEEGLEVVLVNSNPATIMTDRAMARASTSSAAPVTRHVMSVVAPSPSPACWRARSRATASTAAPSAAAAAEPASIGAAGDEPAAAGTGDDHDPGGRADLVARRGEQDDDDGRRDDGDGQCPR